MHLAIGEEAIAAGINAHLQEGDVLALDHRGTPALMMRGIDPLILLKEFLGQADGLCKGIGRHMHLFSAEHLAPSSGIVGASAPAALGFAISAQSEGPVIYLEHKLLADYWLDYMGGSSRKTVQFARVCTTDTIPYSRNLEDEALPNTRKNCRFGQTITDIVMTRSLQPIELAPQTKYFV